ncbi:MAG: hypothetical protein ACKO9T_09500, partial [Nitrospira sp.]
MQQYMTQTAVSLQQLLLTLSAAELGNPIDRCVPCVQARPNRQLDVTAYKSKPQTRSLIRKLPCN